MPTLNCYPKGRDIIFSKNLFMLDMKSFFAIIVLLGVVRIFGYKLREWEIISYRKLFLVEKRSTTARAKTSILYSFQLGLEVSRGSILFPFLFLTFTNDVIGLTLNFTYSFADVSSICPSFFFDRRPNLEVMGVNIMTFRHSLSDVIRRKSIAFSVFVDGIDIEETSLLMLSACEFNAMSLRQV